jgi:hypothetical protein
MNNIHPSLQGMAWPIHELDFLEGNPRKGNVDAIAASYKEFGQVKPIVAKKNKDGSGTVIAGNHQLMAAIKLGWDKIAVIFLDADDKQAVAYALADNRTMELGYTDDDLLQKMLTEVSTEFSDLWTGLGWDEFEMAAMDEKATIKANEELTNSTYIAPVIVAPPSVSAEMDKQIKSLAATDEDGETKLIAPKDVDHSEVAIRGSAVALPGSAPQAIVSVQVVFDSPEQQRRWYDFIRWLRNDPSIDGTTTAERLINFIDAHTDA